MIARQRRDPEPDGINRYSFQTRGRKRSAIPHARRSDPDAIPGWLMSLPGGFIRLADVRPLEPGGPCRRRADGLAAVRLYLRRVTAGLAAVARLSRFRNVTVCITVAATCPRSVAGQPTFADITRGCASTYHVKCRVPDLRRTVCNLVLFLENLRGSGRDPRRAPKPSDPFNSVYKGPDVDGRGRARFHLRDGMACSPVSAAGSAWQRAFMERLTRAA